jgi:hypothetical protein
MLTVALILNLFLPQQPVSVEIKTVSSPKVTSMATYQVVAVAGFTGRQGDQLTREIESAIQSAAIGGVRSLRVVPKEAVVSGLRNRNFSLDNALDVARAHRADAIVYGEVTTAESRDSTERKTETQCVEAKKSSNVLKQMFGCERSQEVSYTCTTRKAEFSFFLRMYDVARRELILAEPITGAVETTACKDQALPSGQEVLAAAYANAMRNARALMLPTEIVTRVELLAPDDVLKRGETRKNFESALEFAKAARMDRACDLFRNAFESEKQSVALTYNVGVCEEAGREAWKAYELYQAADKLTSKPVEQIGVALKRTQGSLRNQQTIAAARPEFAKSAGLRSGASEPESKRQLVLAAPAKLGKDEVKKISSERRLALVIGNAKYRQAALRNPTNDAQDMAASLKEVGFEVMTVYDGSREQMMSAIKEFGDRAPPDGVALFYYAGHASSNGEANFLWPVDQVIAKEADQANRAINANEVLGALDHAKTRINIVILDACRNNPLAGKRAAKAGLASMDAPSGTLLAYSAAPGKTADDGPGRNGFYTSFLLNEIRRPNMKVEDVFKNVRLAMRSERGAEQTPWETSSLTGDFYFLARAE